ncbi:MAG: hypothetical protein HZY76_23205 [Anaerolineae bacterium]|nr:MAG: hypothetical protein HZY76_23205 [Anaerolineae bacterium]
MDLPTTNPPEYTPTHHALLNAQAQVLIVEGLRGLERLQSRQVILMALPLRLRGRDETSVELWLSMVTLGRWYRSSICCSSTRRIDAGVGQVAGALIAHQDSATRWRDARK